MTLKNTITVFRVENEEGKGPYTSTREPCLLDAHSDDGKHPLPYEDGVFAYEIDQYSKDARKHSYGFPSVESVSNWFNDEELVWLSQEGFSINTYEVSQKHVRQGKMQLAFLKEKATFKGKFL
jgi:hypothetical protein